MQVSDKLIRPLTEAKYLNADNVSRYRCIMRIFFEHYEKLKYWLYQEEVYEEMIQDPLFADYRPEQCQQDLTMLTEWKNLNTIQDTKKVASIEEFKNKKYRYQMTEYSVEIERLVIRQILDEMIYNICENAIKYNKEGGKLTVWVGNTLQGKKVCVTDTGIGIPENETDRIFERFYRVDKSHSKETGGTGLGLSIVKHGAMLHGAKIHVDSKLGEGTKIELIF